MLTYARKGTGNGPTKEQCNLFAMEVAIRKAQRSELIRLLLDSAAPP